ncbi:PREDICTED: scavenger receptor class B member 1 isoform X2 [Nicrophorus vespilloides]|uniref:Scavenger receptor class B member 1 isoform X2 n=1 Tax=Nicrophorus vespilloides TaxID=110193 RepID=A0ABM1MXD0_NICVS|nr:PREDICTED: scavenger receptor class B member 1 isoform X2 [Nicrophorus vespilloides]
MTHKSTLRVVGQNARNRLFSGKPKMQMLISQKVKYSRLAVIFLGIFTLTMGIIFSSIPWIDYLILKQLRLWNGSLSFQYWQKPGVIRLTKVYIFNMTNPETFLSQGEKPRLQEIGPFVYREDMEKVNIKFHDNGTVTFQHKKILQFVPEMSVNKHEKLTVPNIPLLSLSTQSNSLSSFVQRMISFVLNVGTHKPFITLTAEDLVFGYEDGIVNLAHHFYPKHKKPKDNKMGLLNGRNGTLKEIQTIYTGETGMQEFGLMEKMNGEDRLPFWEDSPCSNLKGSEGSFFPPRHFTKEDVIHVFDKDICRILPLRYRHSEIKHGISVDVYTPPTDVYESAEIQTKNKCFCPGNQYCPPSGLQSIGPCHYDAPLYVSNPHFYKADVSLLEKIDGLSPDKDKHSTYFKIQPKLGVPLEAKVRLQVNLKVDRAPNVRIVSNFPSIIFPIMWIEEGISDVTPPIRRWIYLATTFSDMASPLLTYGFIFLGSCVLIGVFINTYKSIVFTKETIEVGMKTFRRGNSFNNKMLIVRDSYSLLENIPDSRIV